MCFNSVVILAKTSLFRREERGGDRIERRDEKRPGGGNSWRSREEARKEEPREEKPRPAREEDEDGWTTVRR